MVNKYALLVLAPIFSMMCNVFTHVIISRFYHGRSQIKCLFLCFIFGLICMVSLAVGIHFPQANSLDFFAYLLLGCISYVVLAYGYFHFVNVNIASLRIRILQEIIDSPGGLTEEGILYHYNAEQILDNRIDRLVSSNQLVEKQGIYFLGPNRNFLILFWFFEALKFVFLGRGNRLLREE